MNSPDFTRMRREIVHKLNIAQAHVQRFWTGANGRYETDETMIALSESALEEEQSLFRSLAEINRALGLPHDWREV